MARLFASLPEDDGLYGSRRVFAVAIVLLGTTMAVLDSSIVSVALPTIAKELDVDPARVVWVTNAYQLATAVTIVAFAALGDMIGYRLIYTAGLVVFTAASLACAVSPSLEMLIVSRVVQGIGCSAMMSVGPALNRHIFPQRLLGSALGLTALTVATSSAAGPMIGGLMLAVLDWPWLFAINVPLGILAVSFALRALPTNPRRGGGFDYAGAILSGSAMGAFVIGVDGLSKDYSAGTVATLLIVSVVAGFGFVIRQRQTIHPLLPLKIFNSVRFSFAAVTSLCSFISQGLTFLTLPFLFQSVYGYTPLMSGLLFTPWPLTIAFAAPIAGRLADRFSARVLSTVGLAVLAAGLALLALLGSAASPADIIWRGAICGLGFGFFQSPNNRELLGNVPKTLSGAASGVLASARTFGQSVGAAVAAIILAASVSMQAAGPGAISPTRIHLALWIACLAAGGAFCASVLRTRHREAQAA